MSLPTVSSIHQLRTSLVAWREKGESVAFVPTMGALHRGHIALVTAAQKVARRVVVSIFVNPTQFGPKEDFSAYPRQLAADQAMLAAAGCDLLYAPDVDAMYPSGFTTRVEAGGLATVLEGASRPGHFSGVATVVTKLLLQVLPDVAFFGEKDFQQLLVIRQVVRDMDIPVHIVGVPTVREEDGVALSSRNAYLSPEERAKAALIPATMREVAIKIASGADVSVALNEGRKKLTDGGFTLDYLQYADADMLQPVDVRTPWARLFFAGRIGKTRLIDNIAVDSQ